MDAVFRDKHQNEAIDKVEEEHTSEFQPRNSNREVKLTEKITEYRQQEFKKKKGNLLVCFNSGEKQ